MADIRAKIEIARPLPEVWRCFLDPASMTRWLTGLQNVEVVAGTAGETGSRYRLLFAEDNRIVTMEEELLEVWPQELLIFSMELPDLRGRTEVSFQSVSDSTEVVRSTRISGKGAMRKLAIALMQSRLAKRQEQDLQNFKRLLESDQRQGDQGQKP